MNHIFIKFIFPILFISLLFSGCSDDGTNSYYPPVDGGIIISVVSPIENKVINPETGETLYITLSDNINVAGYVYGIVPTYSTTCEEAEPGLMPLSINWSNLTTESSAEGVVFWSTTYGTLWNTCKAVFSLDIDLVDANNTIEIMAIHENGSFVSEELFFNKIINN